MTRIDFYVLQSNDVSAQRTFVCRLIDKAVSNGSRVMVITNNAEESQVLDRLLWEFKPESYIPHEKLHTNIELTTTTTPTTTTKNNEPVAISHEFDDARHHDMLINMCLNIPKQFSRFERVAEIVDQRDIILSASRRNYTYYKERGYPIHTHKLNF